MADSDLPLPDSAVETVATLTRRARRGDEGAIAERDALLDRHGYAASIENDALRLYPADWGVDSSIDTDQFSTDAVVRIQLGRDDLDAIAPSNRPAADRVADQYGDPHGATADAFATYMNNHHAARIDAATKRQVERFRDEYFVRNVWPTAEQRSCIDDSLDHVFDVATEIAAADPAIVSGDR